MLKESFCVTAIPNSSKLEHNGFFRTLVARIRSSILQIAVLTFSSLGIKVVLLEGVNHTLDCLLEAPKVAS